MRRFLLVVFPGSILAWLGSMSVAAVTGAVVEYRAWQSTPWTGSKLRLTYIPGKGLIIIEEVVEGGDDFIMAE